MINPPNGGSPYPTGSLSGTLMGSTVSLNGSLSRPEHSSKYYHMMFACAALQGLLQQHDSIILAPAEMAQKAWGLADAMVVEYRKQGQL